MYDGNIQIAISQLRQTRHFWVLNGGEGFVVGKRVIGDMETIIIDQTVRIWWHITLSAGFDGITFRCFRDNDVNSLTIVATSREYTDFAFVTLTREELSSGLEDRKYDGIIIWDCLNDTQIPYGKFSGIAKGLTSVEGVPALTVSFLVTGIPQEEDLQDSNELSAVGKLEL